MKSLYINLLLSIIFILIIVYFIFYQRSYNEKENICNLNQSLMKYNLTDQNSRDKWYQYKSETLNSPKNHHLFKNLQDIQAGQVPLPKDQLNIFYANDFDAECCFKPQNYSSSSGCACISEKQMRFLYERGGT